MLLPEKSLPESCIKNKIPMGFVCGLVFGAWDFCDFQYTANICNINPNVAKIPYRRVGCAHPTPTTQNSTKGELQR
jgi:hypothetical protein